jgi:oxygen-dependent protoporphyrinogen oxidase
MKREPRHVVIAGGGITGLSAAFYLRKLCRERDIPLRLTVVERAQTLGGKIRTLRRDGHVIERGPDSFLARKTAILDLTRELGLEPELVPTRPEAGVSYILRGGELHRMPGGSMLGIPTKLKPFLQSGLVSPAGKARAALDLILPSRKESGDESLGAFFRRRLGDEVTETLVEPILAGIYSGDLDRLSLQATYPMFHEVERRYRSVIRGLKRGGLQQTAQPNAAPPLPEHLRRSLFLSYKDGLSALVEKLENALSDASLVSGEEIVRVSSSPEGLTLEAASGTAYRADAAVLAVPAFALGKLLPNLPAAQAFARTPYVSVANVVFGYPSDAVRFPFAGSGFVIPRREGRFITACTWTSLKWGHTAPAGRTLIRCYVGRAGDQAWTSLDDETIIAGVKRELRELMGIQAEPDLVELTRLMQSMPQYEVGHLERIRALRAEMEAALPGAYATGSAFDGIGIPDCIRQGKEAAEYVLERWK